jgi:hypothetical protein
LTEFEFNRVALAQHVNPLTENGALVKEILPPSRPLDKSEPFVSNQSLDRSGHSLASTLWLNRRSFLHRNTAQDMAVTLLL